MMRGMGCVCARRGRAKKPEDEVDIVAGFRKKRAVAVSCLPAPVPAHVRVGEVPPSYWFAVFEGDNVSDYVI